MKQLFVLLIVCSILVFARGEEAATTKESDVVILTDANFDKLVANGDWYLEL
jgi:hypothetical protein